MKPHRPVAAGLHTASAALPAESRLPGFGGATGWLSSPPLAPDVQRGKPDVQRGKVVLVGFWTYTCVSWLRQFPYLRAWGRPIPPS